MIQLDGDFTGALAIRETLFYPQLSVTTNFLIDGNFQWGKSCQKYHFIADIGIEGANVVLHLSKKNWF